MPEANAPRALISVFHKNGIAELARALSNFGYQLLSTGGTHSYLSEKGFSVEKVEDLTGYPSILGGRVKTLHPKVFGGILSRRADEGDQQETARYEIPDLQVVVVDLYPFEKTVKAGGQHQDIIEKIDIGGISLIRAAAKNYQDVWVIPSRAHYQRAVDILENNALNESVRRNFAADAFAISAYYDHQIQAYLAEKEPDLPLPAGRNLRYGENPHQGATFHGNLEALFEQIHGKELSYNNLLDLDAAVNLMNDFSEPSLAILKHNNACGFASRSNLMQAWRDALAGDPVSAFGGVIISNQSITAAVAEAIDQIFFEILMAPDFEEEALAILKKKKKRILLRSKNLKLPRKLYRSALNGFLVQERDLAVDAHKAWEVATERGPSEAEIKDLEFAARICKHTKSNTIVLAKGEQLIAAGTGQTSRVDALKQAIAKAENFEFDLKGAVMASDAFFPFADCVEIASTVGISAVVQPGGSIRDQESINFCNQKNMAMVMTGTRHFKH
mgnify:FL=1